MKSVFLPILMLFCAAAQAQITAGQLLASAWDDPIVQLHREQQAYLEGTSFEMPLLRKLEIRTETRNFEPKQQEYALRIGTNGFGMRRTQADIYGSMKELSESERLMLVHEALLDRYGLVLDVFFTQKNLRLLEQQRRVLEDKKAVYSQQLALGLQDNLDDFFRTEDDLLKLKQKIFEAKTDSAQQLTRLKIFTGKSAPIIVDTLVEPLTLVVSLVGSLGITPDLRHRLAQAQLAQQQEKMEGMEGRNLLNYLQFRYSGNPKDLLEDRFAVGAGVSLPWPNGSKLKQQELHLQTLEAQAKAEAERLTAANALAQKSGEWQQLLEQYDFLQKQASEFRQNYNPRQLNASGLQNPETLLRVQETLSGLDLELASLEKQIYQKYISLLGETGLLTQEPARNYLSPSLDLISR